MKKITSLVLALLITQSLFSQIKYVDSDSNSSNLPSNEVLAGYSLITEKEVKDKEAELKFDSEIASSPLLGVYKIDILKHRNLDYSRTQLRSRVYVTEVGITVESEIPSLALLSGSYDKKNTNIEKGRFVCNTSKGYGDIFSLTLNMEYKVGGLSVIDGTTVNTTTFKIID